MVTDSRIGEPKQFSPVSAALLLARADYCPAHKSVCEKMVHGLFEATKLIRESPDQVLPVMKAHFGSYNDKVLQAAYETVKAMTPSPPITTPKDLENGDNMNAAAGFMKPEDKLADYKALIDNQFIK
jgi:hypothetical protein